jgi:protein ImuB
VDPTACVDLPALPLQLLLRRQAEWRGVPVAVVDRMAPQGRVLFCNAKARAAGIEPGWRHAAALGFCPGLRAAEVPASEIDAAVEEICVSLRALTPHVEPAKDTLGAFWLDARGLGRLYPSLAVWAEQVRARLLEKTLHASVAVGFSRFCTCAVARRLVGRRIAVFDSPEQELAAALRVELSRLGLGQELCAALGALAVHTLGDLAKLPAAGLRKRFGPEVHRLHRQASGALASPVQPRAPEDPLVAVLHLDRAEDDRERLIFILKPLLDSLLLKLQKRGQALAELTLKLTLHRAEMQQEQLRPAAPSLDAVQLLGLMKLRLESLTLRAGVIDLELLATPAPATSEQLQLFAQKPKRDLAAAARAFARLRASFGDDAVVKAQLRQAHLPEASFSWEPLHELTPAQPRKVAERPLVRVFHSKPVRLPVRPSREPDGWLILGIEHGPVERLWGPFRVSGGWWKREVERDYWFAQLQNGKLLWVFHDARRRCWFLHGEVR